MAVIIDTAIKTLVGIVIGALIVWVKDVLNKGKTQDNAVKAIAHDSFYRQCRELISKDSITESELENLNYLHEAYTALGMNGTGEELYRRCLEKELKQTQN